MRQGERDAERGHFGASRASSRATPEWVNSAVRAIERSARPETRFASAEDGLQRREVPHQATGQR